LSKENGEGKSSAPQNPFEPSEAIDALKRREWPIQEVIDRALHSAFRDELVEYLKGKRTLRETVDGVQKILEPWIGDPTKIRPGSNDLLDKDRLETIVRTETTWAYNQGRLAVADTVGDYIIGFQFSAIIDDRCTKICRKADGLVFHKNDPRATKLVPPLHPACRSVLVYVTQADMPVTWSTDKEIDAVLKLKPKGFR
jgi:SPP1 gp7 family putative phage head morphogenesis protein